MSVWILRKTFSSLAWCELLEQAASAAGWPEGKEVFTYHEGLHECRFDRRVWSTLEPPKNGWEGRLFEEPSELRWSGTAGGLYDGWLVREHPGQGEGFEGPLVRKTPTYFLLGRYSTASQGFVEARYPGVTFKYPGIATPADGTRARVEVAEYRRKGPTTWSTIGSEGGVNEELASALLVEHRFVCVKAG